MSFKYISQDDLQVQPWVCCSSNMVDDDHGTSELVEHWWVSRRLKRPIWAFGALWYSRQFRHVEHWGCRYGFFLGRLRCCLFSMTHERFLLSWLLGLLCSKKTGPGLGVFGVYMVSFKDLVAFFCGPPCARWPVFSWLENVFWQSCARHSGHMTSPSKLGLYHLGWTYWAWCHCHHQGISPARILKLGGFSLFYHYAVHTHEEVDSSYSC